MTDYAPILFLPHGGGPLPVLGEPGHASLVAFLEDIPRQLGQPDAMVVISAHWEEKIATVTGGATPELIYDYYNFPPESYQLTYPAPGHPVLARRICELLAAAGFDCRQDPGRGFDHGLFIPLMLMYPQAQIPCVQVSLSLNLDPDWHLRLGQALAPLRERNVMIVGSGMSYHNLKEFFGQTESGRRHNLEFDNWLLETCAKSGLDEAGRYRRLRDWASAPSARECHPREEHLLPLHVCAGAASGRLDQVETVFNGDIMGRRATAFLWT